MTKAKPKISLLCKVNLFMDLYQNLFKSNVNVTQPLYIIGLSFHPIRYGDKICMLACV